MLNSQSFAGGRGGWGAGIKGRELLLEITQVFADFILYIPNID